MKVAGFTYYGGTTDKDREVRLRHNLDGTFTVDIEGMPVLTQTVKDRDRAEEIFRGWWEMSMKDWGSSEIKWNE